LQISTGQTFERQLRTTALALVAASAQAVVELEAEPSLSADNLRAAVRTAQTYGINPDLRKILTENNINCCNIIATEQFVAAIDATTIPSGADLTRIVTRGLLSSVEYSSQRTEDIVTDRRHVERSNRPTHQ
jgi:hypothetical protein